MLSRRLRARIEQRDAGVTLVELLVTLGLATIVGTMTLLLFTSANASVNATTDRIVGTADARTVLQSWQALLQSADVAPATNGSGAATGSCPSGSTTHRFEWLTNTEVAFYADLANRSASGTTCTPPTLIWLGLRNGQLIEGEYAVSTGGTTFSLSTCLALTDQASAKVSTNSLFTPNPGQVLFSVDYGATFAATTGFASTTSCATMPTSVSVTGMLDTDAAANNALAQMRTVGIDFTVSDSTGAHTQNFDATVPILGGISS